MRSNPAAWSPARRRRPGGQSWNSSQLPLVLATHSGHLGTILASGDRTPRIAHSAAGRLTQCRSGVMMKSVAIAAAAALSGPIIGVAVFFAANSDHSNREGASLTVAGLWGTPKNVIGPTRHHQNICASRAAARPYLNRCTRAQTTICPTIRKLTEPPAWLTVVTCAEGQPLLKNGRCPAPKSVPSTGMGAIVDGTPTADGVGSGRTSSSRSRAVLAGTNVARGTLSIVADSSDEAFGPRRPIWRFSWASAREG